MDMGRGEERVRCVERAAWKLILPYAKTDSQRGYALWLRKLKQGLGINLAGCDGREMGGRLKRDGIYVYLWLIHVEV